MDGNVVQEFIEAIKEPQVDTNKTYIATVSRIDNEGVVWVHVQGSEKETPTELSAAEVKVGDTVNVEWRNNKLYIATNVSNPSVGVMTVAPAVDYINLLEGKDISVNSIQAATGYIDELYSKNITTDSLVADHAMIKELDVESMSAATAYIRDLTSENITADDIIADHATIDTLDSTYATIDELHSDYAHITNGVIDNATIGQANVNGLNTNYAQINAANITDLTTQSAWVDQLMVQTGLIAHDGVIYELDAIQVNASKIKTGTLDVERLIVSVPDSQDPTIIHKYMVHVDPTTGTPSYEKVDADILEDLTITADKIVAGAITAEKITTDNIVGSGGWINLRNGTFAYTNATSGDGISWDGTTLTINSASLVLNSRKFIAPQFATSSTAGGTAAKTATITPAVTGWQLYTGATVTVKFTTANTNATPTLNINSTGAKAIKTYANGNMTEAEYKWAAGSTFTFVYNGTNWLMQDSSVSVRMNSAETSISQNAEQIQSKASQSSVDSLSGRVSTAESTITQQATAIEAKVSKDGVIASINASVEEQGGSAVRISADKVNIEGAAIFTGNGRLSSTSLDNAYDSKGSASTAESNAKGYTDAATSDMATNTSVASVYATKAAANAQEQLIYKSAVSGTTSMSGTTTWITSTSDAQNAWTTKRPTYSSSYPVLFVATQRKSVGGTVTCTTPVKDDTTTIIDGGNIITGTVTANKLNASDINASNSLTIGALSTTTQSDILNSNIEIGGRNLLLASNKEVIKDISVNKENVTFGYLSDYGKTVLGKTGTKVTISFEAKASVAGLIVGGRYIRNASGTAVTDATDKNHSITLTTSYVRYEGTCSITATGAAIMQLYYGSNTATSGSISVRNAKVEVGNKVTDWTPAPEDAVNDNLLIGSQKMSAWRLGGSASRDTTDDFGVITLTGSSSNWNATTDYMPTLRTSILDGTPLWLSFEYKASTAITSMNLILAGTALAEGSYFTSSQRTKYSNNMLSSLPAASSWTRKAVAMPTSLSELVSGSGNVNSIYVQFYNRTDNSTVQIRKVKLEHGFSATDWTSSSEDQKAYITRIDDAGIRIHPSNTENNSVVINASGMEIFKGGTGTSNSVAFYGDTTRVGAKANNKTRLELSNTNMDIVFRNSSGTDATLASFGTEAVIRTADGTELAHFGYESGAGPDDGTATAPYYNLGYRSTTSSRGNLTSKGNFSLASGASNIASGFCSHAEGYGSEASGYASHAEGTSYAEAEKAHAEGHGCIAANPYSHAEGYYCHAAGDSSHAEGFMCVTGSAHSHASGIGTHSYRQGQTVVGSYNVLNAYSLFIVGNGTSDSARSDAFWVDPDGSATSAAGMLTQNGQAKVPDVFYSPPASESYGCIVRLWGDGMPNASHQQDTYWLGVGSSGKLYTGTQISGATAITWREK